MTTKPTPTDDPAVKLIPAKDHPAAPTAEEDEINLLDLFLVLLRHKFLILFLVIVAGAGAVFYSLSLENIYRSDATLTPREEEKSGPSIPSLGGLGGMMAGQLGLGGGGSLEKLEVVLNSRELTLKIINKYDLMPIIFQEQWDEEKGTWNAEVEEPPTLQDGMKAVKDGMLKVSSAPEKGTLTVGIEHKNPEIAKKWVEYYVKELSGTLRAEVLHDANENKRFFREQLDRTSDALLKEKIYNMLAKEIEKETFASAQKYYSFQVIDRPIVPDPDKKVAPKRSIICILSVFVAFFFAVFLSFFLEFIRRIKTDDPERYRQIKDGLKPWKRI